MERSTRSFRTLGGTRIPCLNMVLNSPFWPSCYGFCSRALPHRRRPRRRHLHKGIPLVIHVCHRHKWCSFFLLHQQKINSTTTHNPSISSRHPSLSQTLANYVCRTVLSYMFLDKRISNKNDNAFVILGNFEHTHTHIIDCKVVLSCPLSGCVSSWSSSF